ncbi:hypothetical protein CEUSTIGMA_g5939.t1 [Chlamydomonas eustigma]|uniref:S1-like domain-containing protein n=1 Tax=Chlamydomonas eustigma TaxID=1157962 RepID=A0A250X6W3_9CHLO|nr:hypothetical protein CEUSTIGMA_g5939.t1 [Chlamydomonas eustigma]|eukprot:GAX78500.1 hypothetical protein CEUSTIGMA_g5939.t1 [Chlamydomonas eustigma]
MSRRRKHVTMGVLDTECVIKPGHVIARVSGVPGGNILEVIFPSGHTTMSMIPQKFHKKLWVRKGGYVVIDEMDKMDESRLAAKVTGTICQILYDDQIKALKKSGQWPDEFAEAAAFVPLEVVDGQCTDSGPHVVLYGGHKDAHSSVMTATRNDVVRSTQDCEGRGDSCCSSGVQGNIISSEGSKVVGMEDQEQYEEEDDDDGLPPLFQNLNRRVVYHEASSDESDDEG